MSDLFSADRPLTDFPSIGFVDGNFNRGVTAGTEALDLNATPNVKPHGRRVRAGGDLDEAEATVYTFAVERDGAYHLTLSPMDAGLFGELTTSLTMWLRGLPEGVKLYIYAGEDWCDGGGCGVYTIDWYLALINSLLACRAQTVYVIDRNLDGVNAYLALTAKAIAIGSAAALELYPNAVLTSGNRSGQVLKPFLAQLYARAVALGLLTAEEEAQLNNGQEVMLLPSALSARTGEGTSVFIHA